MLNIAPPAAASPVKASLTIRPSAAGTSLAFSASAKRIAMIYKRAIPGTRIVAVRAIRVSPPNITAAVTMANTVPPIKLKTNGSPPADSIPDSIKTKSRKICIN